MMESDHLPRQARDNKNTREKTETTRPVFAAQEIHIAPDVALFIKQVRKRHFLSHSYIKCIILPRQARDKHRESTQKSAVFSQYYQLTQNRTELAELYPLLEGVADFLVSRVNRTDDQGWLSIETIVGADEVRSTPAFFFPLSSVSLSS
eukprot:COSAG06_NODE_2274_length_7194_cov_81.563073_10_plen_149_part_00